MFKTRSQGQSIDRPVCGESFCQEQSNTAGSPSNVQISLCKPPALPYQQCTCIGVSMRERKHSPALRWTELLRSVPNICCGDLGNFRPYGAFQSSFAVSPLLELQQQRETVRFVLPSALHKGTSTTDTDGDMPPGWLRSQSLHTPRKPSRPVTATRFYERQQTAADPLLWGPVIQHSMVNSATPDAPWKSPAMCARRIIQTVFARSKFIARWLQTLKLPRRTLRFSAARVRRCHSQMPLSMAESPRYLSRAIHHLSALAQQILSPVSCSQCMLCCKFASTLPQLHAAAPAPSFKVLIGYG